MIGELNKFEKEVIEFILKQDAPQYLSHMKHLVVTKRENTGAGLYVNFAYESKPEFFKDETLPYVGTSVYADIKDVKYGAGFMLTINNGKITQLEAFFHAYSAEESDWPNNITEFELKHS